MNEQRTHSHISQLNHDVLKYASFVCSAPCSYRSLRSIGSNLQQQTDQLPQLSSSKGKYIALLNIGEGFISLTFPVIGRRVLLQAFLFTHHILRPDLSCIRILFCDIAPCCVTSPYLTCSPSHSASGFSGQRRAQGYQCLFHHPSPPLFIV